MSLSDAEKIELLEVISLIRKAGSGIDQVRCWPEDLRMWADRLEKVAQG